MDLTNQMLLVLKRVVKPSYEIYEFKDWNEWWNFCDTSLFKSYYKNSLVLTVFWDTL